jgi:3-oxoadipate enol-lactonase
VKSGFAPLHAASIYYESAGAGPPVVLIHAGVADSRMWDGAFEALSERFRPIRFDVRGFGRSSMPPGRFSYHGDVAALLDHVAVTAASIIGCSFGGQIAIDFALAYPDRVRSLVLVSAGIGGREPSQAMIRFGDEEDALLGRGDVDGATDLNVRTWVDGPHRTPSQVDPSIRERVRSMQRELFLTSAPEGVTRDRLQPPAIERLEEIGAPTLVLVGDRDVEDMLEAGELLASRIPSARKIVLSGAGHLVSMERPEEFGDLVTGFLAASA